mmetsp:Transcript_118422/g.330323  ORF Transcript_118422/g.330323 Transcript_118422/m.330323 type:complete len:209 (+) Transcript_118422:46-672(+)
MPSSERRARARHVLAETAETAVQAATCIATHANKRRWQRGALVVQVARLVSARTDRLRDRATRWAGGEAQLGLARQKVVEAAESTVLPHTAGIAAQAAPPRRIVAAAVIPHAELLPVVGADCSRHLATRKPSVWFLVDCFLLGGGCAFWPRRPASLGPGGHERLRRCSAGRWPQCALDDLWQARANDDHLKGTGTSHDSHLPRDHCRH